MEGLMVVSSLFCSPFAAEGRGGGGIGRQG